MAHENESWSPRGRKCSKRACICEAPPKDMEFVNPYPGHTQTVSAIYYRRIVGLGFRRITTGTCGFQRDPALQTALRNWCISIFVSGHDVCGAISRMLPAFAILPRLLAMV